MARPPQADAARTRARILEVASELFADKGEGGATMREIAKRAGVTQAAVHHYFGTKAALYDAVLAAMYDELDQLRLRFAQAVQEGGDLATLARRVVHVSYRFGLEHRATARLGLRRVVDASGPSKREEVLATFLGQGAGLLAAQTGDDPERVRMVLLSLNFLVVRYALMSADELSLMLAGQKAVGDELDPALLERVERHLTDVALGLLGLD